MRGIASRVEAIASQIARPQWPSQNASDPLLRNLHRRCFGEAYRDIHSRRMQWLSCPVQDRIHCRRWIATSTTKPVQRRGYHVTSTMEPHPRETTTSETSRQAVLRLLEERNPDRILHALLDPSLQDILIRSLPSVTFVEILRLLDPQHFIEPYKKVHKDLHSPLVLSKGLKPIEQVFAEFIENIGNIISKRRGAGHAIGVNEYSLLLKCARSIGDAEWAATWWVAMEKDGVTPNTACYNYYMEAKCWSGAFLSEERQMLRVIPFNQKRRQQQRSDENKGYRTGAQGIRNEMLYLFDEMVERGGEADELTFINLMTAMGREGDIAGAKRILKTVWNIDVDQLLELDEGEMDHPTIYEKGSPLHPSFRLLFAIAHTFGSNNDIPVALRLVDFVSRQYSVPITMDAWSQLLEWTFVLSRPRFLARKTDGASAGKLPLKAVGNLETAMTGDPYKVLLSMPMLNIIVKNKLLRGQSKPALHLIRQGRSMFRSSLARHQRARRRLATLENILRQREERVQKARSVEGPQPQMPPKEWFEAQREVELSTLILERDRLFLQRWTRLLLAEAQYLPEDPNLPDPSFYKERVFIPRRIEEFREFLPNLVTYDIFTAKVTFPPGQRKSNAAERPAHPESTEFMTDDPEEVSIVRDGQVEDAVEITEDDHPG